MVSMSGMKKAASSIGRTMTRRVGMSQVGLCLMARDISNDSILDPNIRNVGVIARACSLNRKFQEIVAGRGVVSYTHCCQIHTRNKRSRSELAHSILQISQITQSRP